jgi:hypothetical protein
MNKMLLAGLIALGGCSQLPVRHLQSTPCPQEPGGWCADTRTTADNTWVYAQLANNAYAREPAGKTVLLHTNGDHFRLPPGWIERVHVPNDGIGFAYAVFDRFEGRTLKETVVAFRGTEITSGRDWLIGNFLGAQNRRGWAVAKGVRKSLDDNGWAKTDLIVTGHSLGGGIAQFVSLRNVSGTPGKRASVAKSIVFDNSPRYWKPFTPVAEVERIAVIERGEILSAIRWGRPPLDGQRTMTINCQPGYNAFKGHRIAPLAACLTWISAFNDTPACDSIDLNPEIKSPPSQESSAQPRCVEQSPLSPAP